MGNNTEDMIKGSISQTIVEELFKDLGFYVLRTGQENIANPLTQLEHFIKECEGNFKLEKSEQREYLEIDYLKKMPDFCVISKEGKVFFIEVKYREKGMIGEEKLKVFDFFPETYMIIVNLKVGDKLIFTKEDTEFKIDKNANTESLKNSRFNVLSYEKDGKIEEIYSSTLSEWLKGIFNLEQKGIIEKYEKLVTEWLH
ncbi:MAG: hypothetical protein WC511_00420 [Candidatus Pacearchaeota archaeon]